MATGRMVRNNKKLIGISACLLVVLCVAGVVMWRSSIQSPNVIKNEDRPEFSALGLQTDAAYYLNEGDTEGGLKYYDDQIRLWEDSEKEKRLLLIFKSNFARMSESFDLAIDTAKKADDIDSDAMSIRAVAQAYRANGDREEALVYYKKLLDTRQSEEGESNPDDLLENGREETLGSIIRELENNEN